MFAAFSSVVIMLSLWWVECAAMWFTASLTPSTIFDFMSGKSKCPKVITIKKICSGANITLEEFFAKEYFNGTDDVY